MSNNLNAKNIIRSIIWKFSERGISIIISFIINIILTRILLPEEYGAITIISSFIIIIEVFVTNGFMPALIQKKEIDDLDYSTSFWSNLILGVFFYLIIFFLSPIIERYFNYSGLSLMIKILSTRILILAMNSIQIAYISKNMLFKYYFYSTLFGRVLSGVLGIICALASFKEWALIVQMLSLSTIEFLVLYRKISWKPRLQFSMEKLRILFKFAWKITLMSICEMGSEQLKKLSIGKNYTSSELAYYDRGFLLPNTIITNITSSLSSVMYPVLSKNQDIKNGTIIILRQWISLFFYLGLPILLLLLTISDGIIILLFSEKWITSVLYMKIACLIYLSWIIEVPIRESIKAFGKPEVCLKIQVIKSILSILILIITLKISIKAILLGSLFSSFLNIVVSIYYGNKILNYKIFMFLEDIFFTSIIGGITYIITYNLFKNTLLDNFLVLICQFVIFIFSYIILSILTKNKNYIQVSNLIKMKVFKL